jgi:serine/threonine protein phosphatase PrpC
MGAYLSVPNTDKELSCGEDAHVRFGLCAMQGWRLTQEDSHCVHLALDEQHTSFFAVFDGHGGAEARASVRRGPRGARARAAAARRAAGRHAQRRC